MVPIKYITFAEKIENETINYIVPTANRLSD